MISVTQKTNVFSQNKFRFFAFFVLNNKLWWWGTIPGEDFLFKEIAFFLIGFGGGVHNMDKKVTKFSSEKKNKKQLKKIFFCGGQYLWEK
jgi:hypothetical protein